VFGNIASELTGKSVLPPKSAQSIVTESLGKTKSAKALAHRLWFSFVMEGNDCLHLSDVQEVLGAQSQDIAEECFEMLDPDGNGDVTLDEITMKLTELALERKAIARSMHDVSQAIKALDNVMSSVAFLLSLFALSEPLSL
jgi:Ca2+-binding EF-hand superfamily protein